MPRTWPDTYEAVLGLWFQPLTESVEYDTAEHFQYEHLNGKEDIPM